MEVESNSESQRLGYTPSKFSMLVVAAVRESNSRGKAIQSKSRKSYDLVMHQNTKTHISRTVKLLSRFLHNLLHPSLTLCIIPVLQNYPVSTSRVGLHQSSRPDSSSGPRNVAKDLRSMLMDLSPCKTETELHLPKRSICVWIVFNYCSMYLSSNVLKYVS